MLNRLLLLFAAALIGLQLSQPAGAAEDVTELNLFVGEVRTLPLTKIQRIALGNGKVITANVLEKDLLLLGEAPGRTSMVIWTLEGKEFRYNGNGPGS